MAKKNLPHVIKNRVFLLLIPTRNNQNVSRKMNHLFPNHRRVTRRHLKDAALGNSTTVSAAIVWLVAFATLWLVILSGFGY